MPKRIDPSAKLSKIALLALQFGWSDVEIKHAEEALPDEEYGNESVVFLGNGREIRYPAPPSCCEYVRITQAGFELAYWHQDEWEEAPAEVMGAILGAASRSAGAVPTNPVAPALQAYAEECEALGVNAEHVESVRLLKLRADQPTKKAH